jgi:hypothetical protein
VSLCAEFSNPLEGDHKGDPHVRVRFLELQAHGPAGFVQEDAGSGFDGVVEGKVFFKGIKG